MKTIIAGMRDFEDYETIEKAIHDSKFTITEIVSGKCSGADTLGERYANCHRIPIAAFPAEWKKFGRHAGPIRNLKMAQYAEALIAVWDGKSKGTKNMIKLAEQNGLKVYVHRINL